MASRLSVPSLRLPDLRFDIEKQLDAISLENKTPSRGSHETGGTFAWRDIAFSVDTKAGKKQILQNVSGFVEKGIFMRWPNPKSRSNASDHGPLGVRENDAVEYPVS
jgi:hypothetical protein